MQENATEHDLTLEGRGWIGRVPIPPGQASAFADWTLAMRRRALSMSVLIGTGFYTVFAPGDVFAVPDQLRLALIFRFVIMLPLGLAVLYWLYRARASLMCQQVVACGFHLLAVLLLSVLLVRSDSVNALGFVFANYAVLMAMVISMALPLRLVMALSLVVVLIQAVAIAHGPLQLPVLEIHNVMIAIVIIGPAIFANRTLENERRRYFVLVEREQRCKRQLAEQRDMLGRLAALDPLTDLANRRGFHAGLANDLDRMAPGTPVAMAMIDIDSFKAYNDHYGHAAGDRALRRVAQALAAAAEPQGRAGRIGGEEFAIFVSGFTDIDIESYAERLRASVQNLALVHHHSATADVMTVSVGLALGGVGTSNTALLFETADAALYRAKAAGRNRVAIEDMSRPDMGSSRAG